MTLFTYEGDKAQSNGRLRCRGRQRGRETPAAPGQQRDRHQERHHRQVLVQRNETQREPAAKKANKSTKMSDEGGREGGTKNPKSEKHFRRYTQSRGSLNNTPYCRHTGRQRAVEDTQNVKMEGNTRGRKESNDIRRRAFGG